VYAVIDVETTGKDPWRNEILQMGMVVVNEELETIGEFNEFIRPQYLRQWSEEAEEIHKISQRRAAKFDSSRDVFDKFNMFLRGIQPDGAYGFICHASPRRSRINLFDRNFVFAWYWSHSDRLGYYRQFDERKVQSTIKRERNLAKQNWGIENQKLGTWAKKLNIEFEHHTALADAKVCLEILKFQRRNLWQQDQQQPETKSQHLRQQQELKQERSQHFKLS